MYMFILIGYCNTRTIALPLTASRFLAKVVTSLGLEIHFFLKSPPICDLPHVKTADIVFHMRGELDPGVQNNYLAIIHKIRFQKKKFVRLCESAYICISVLNHRTFLQRKDKPMDFQFFI